MKKIKIDVCFDDATSWGKVLDDKKLVIRRCPKCGDDIYSWNDNGAVLCCECMTLMENIAEVPLDLIIDMLGDIHDN